MSLSPRTNRRDALLDHLDSVYKMAQALTPDADHAVKLVEATYTQAFITLPLGGNTDEDKRSLLQLLMQVHREQQDFESLTSPTPSSSVAEALQALRHRLAEQLATRILPAVVATLAEELRLILLLCVIERMSCADAAPILSIDEETACVRLAEARDTVRAAIQAEASYHEQQLLATLPAGWLDRALRNAIDAEFSPLPPTLRPQVLAVTEPGQKKPLPLPRATPANEQPEASSIAESSAPTPMQVPSQALRRTRRFALTVFLIVTIGLLGMFLSQALDTPPETDLILLSAGQAGDLTTSFSTSSAEQAEEFVLGSLGWRLTLPSIEQAILTGVGTKNVALDVTVPVFLYNDTTDEDDTPIALYVYSYALLDDFEDRIQLEPDVLRLIQNDQHFDLHDLDEQNVLVWRYRDDIFVAVTEGNADLLRSRIIVPS